MNPSTLTQVDYDQHQAFAFDDVHAVSIRLIRDEIQAFDQAYQRARTEGAHLSEKSRGDLSAEILKHLKSIFAKLMGSSTDERQKSFYQELLSYAERVLSDDLKDYFRRRRSFSLKHSFSSKRQSFQKNHYFTDRVSPEVIQKILALGQADLERFWKNVDAGKTSRDDLSVNQGPVVKEIVRILNREYRRLGILDVLSACRNEEIYVSGCAFELSVEKTSWWKNLYPQYPNDTAVAYYHYDEGIANPKSILYLTDTDPSNGPTMAIPNAFDGGAVSPIQYLLGRVLHYVGSAETSALYSYYRSEGATGFIPKNKRKHFMALPPELRFNSHFGFDVIPGSDQEKQLLASEVQITGPAGTCLVFDGSLLLHRGGLVRKGHRIALQIVFARKESIFEKVKRRLKL